MLATPLMGFAAAVFLTMPAERVAVDCDALVRWVARAEAEHPNFDFMNTRWGPAYIAIVLPLFDDATFVPIFGRPFDTMSEGQRNGAVRDLSNCRRRHPELGWAAIFLGNGFRAGHPSWNHQMLLAEVAAMRAARTELEELRALSAGAESADAARLDRLVELRSRGPANLERLWPGERAAYQDVLAAVAAMADRHAMGQRVDGAIASSRGVDPEQALRELDAATSGGRRGRAASATDDVARLAAERAVHEQFFFDSMRGELERLPDNAEGIAAGNRWIAEHERLAPLVRTPEFLFLTREFGQRRATQLRTIAPVLAGEIATAQSPPHLRQIVGRYGFLESDWRSPAFGGMADRVRARQYLLEKIAALGMGETDLVAARALAATSAEPTAEEMYDAVRANYDAANAMNEAAYSRCSERGANVDHLTGLLCSMQWLVTAGGGPLRTTISTFRKSECSRTGESGTFACEFRLGFDMNAPGLRNWMGDVLRSGAASGGSIGYFMETRNGWALVSPPR